MSIGLSGKTSSETTWARERGAPSVTVNAQTTVPIPYGKKKIKVAGKGTDGTTLIPGTPVYTNVPSYSFYDPGYTVNGPAYSFNYNVNVPGYSFYNPGTPVTYNPVSYNPQETPIFVFNPAYNYWQTYIAPGGVNVYAFGDSITVPGFSYGFFQTVPGYTTPGYAFQYGASAVNDPPYSYTATANAPGYSFTVPASTTYNPGYSFQSGTNAATPATNGSSISLLGLTFPGGVAGPATPIPGQYISTQSLSFGQTSIPVTVPTGGYITLTFE